MSAKNKDIIIFVLVGFLVGLVLTVVGGTYAYKIYKDRKVLKRYEPETAKKKSSFFNFKSKKLMFVSFEDKKDVSVFKPAEGTTTEISQSNPTHGKSTLLVKLKEGAKFPGIVWEAYGNEVQDWSKNENFYVDIYNNTEDFISIEIKFKSGKSYPKQSFSYPVQLEPLSLNEIMVPLESLSQTCDLTQMSYVKIFTRSPENNLTLYVDSVGVRKASADDQVASTNEETNNQKQAARVLKEGFDIFTASSLNRIFRDGKTLSKPDFSEKVNVSLAKHEYESFQIVVNNGKDKLSDVRLELSNLVNAQGEILNNSETRWRVVGYVPTKKPYYPVKYVGLWPDPLMPQDKVDIVPGDTQPFWVTLYAPKDARTGLYQGNVAVLSGDKKLKKIPVQINVYDFVLPKESHLKTAFDFYAHEMKSRYPDNAGLNEAQNRANREKIAHKFIIEMLKNRMNPVLNINPTKEKDLAKIEIYRHLGLTSFSVGSRSGTFGNNWPSDDAALEGLLPVYRKYGELLTLNKMIDLNYIYTWDEGKIGNPRVPKVCSLVHRAHPKLKNLVCYHGFWDPEEDPEWGKDIDIWTFQIDKFNQKKMDKLKKHGLEVWMYVSGPGGKGSPNLAIDFDSVDYRVVPWMSWKYDIEGFLYWCVNWWVYKDPFTSAANTKWDQNGNGLMFYPGKDGPINSLRAEIWRDGMEDYEYFVILQNILDQMKAKGLDAAHQDLYNQGRQLLKIDNSIVKSLYNFTKDGKVLKDRRDTIAQTIEKLMVVVNSN